MAKKKTRPVKGQKQALSRDRIIAMSIDLLNHSGEAGLTFRTLSERLETGPGAIYWHIANKGDLLTAACDAILARTLEAPAPGATPEASIRAVALGMYDTIEAHPWVGSALTRAPGQAPILRLFERIGQQICALQVPPSRQWAVTSALLNYILGVSGQNAANAQLARERGLDRSSLLEATAHAWAELDPKAYPFASGVAAQLQSHDDRVDFVAGVDLILRGI